tara:strand:- start:7741 stop:8319 length:579 start_codon:yes stop_codon:yes gene_type:complete
MRKLIFTLTLISFISCKNQIKNRQFFIEEFNWTLVAPEGFKYTSAKEVKKIRGRGMEILKDTYGDEVEDRTINLFFIENGKLNKFEANFQPFDETVDGNYSEANKELNELMVNAFTVNLDDIKIDTISSKEKIDKLDFHLFKIKVTYPNNMVLHTYMFNRLFEKKDLTCTIIFIDEKLGLEMLNSFKKSKFK